MGVIRRTNPSGKAIWGILWVDEQGRRRRKFDQSWNRVRAQTALDEMNERVRSGVASSPEMTVAELFAEWREHHVKVNCSPAYYEDAGTQYRLRIEPMISHRRIDAVNKRVVRQMVAQMQQVMHKREPKNPHAGHRTINKTLTVLKSMFTYAVEIDQLRTNPIHGIPSLVEAPTRQIDAWPMKLIEAVADASTRVSDGVSPALLHKQAPWASQRNRTLILLAAYTGMRQSELIGLHWSDIDDGWVHVSHKVCRRSLERRETKTRRGKRRVPLLGAAKKLLDEWRAVGAHDEIVFPNQYASDYMRASAFDRKVWDRAREAVGTKTIRGRDYDATAMTFHELRHTFVSVCLAAGRDLWEVANWVGDDPEMLKQVYGHYLPDSLGDTSRLDKMLAGG